MKQLLPILYCSLFVILSVLANLTVLRLQSRRQRPPSAAANEFAGIFLGALCLFHSLLVAFVIIAVWDDYEQLNQAIEQETDQLHSIIAHTSRLPGQMQQHIQKAIASYCNLTIKQWEMSGNTPVPAASAIPELRGMLLEVEPRGRLQENAFTAMENNMNILSHARRQRLSLSRSHIPSLVWFALLAGSLLLLIFSYLPHTDDKRLKSTGISFLTAMIAISLFVVYALDHPFTGIMPLSSEPYSRVLVLLSGSS